mmetsp:Transcript_11514/g.13588  ORF Transcript_11514/g.13588 Transcript_11514/m.13588 type:complete len:200 (+) Transcript_11514:85-684(+)
MSDNRGYGDSGGGGNVSLSAGWGNNGGETVRGRARIRFILIVVAIIGALAVISCTFAFVDGVEEEHDITEGYTMSVPLIIVANIIIGTIGICYAWRRMRAEEIRENRTSGDEENVEDNKNEPVKAAQPNMQPQTPLEPADPNYKTSSYPNTAPHSQTAATTIGTQSVTPTFSASNNYQIEQASFGPTNIFDKLKSDARR